MSSLHACKADNPATYCWHSLIIVANTVRHGGRAQEPNCRTLLTSSTQHVAKMECHAVEVARYMRIILECEVPWDVCS
jgi:hypothetical protein